MAVTKPRAVSKRVTRPETPKALAGSTRGSARGEAPVAKSKASKRISAASIADAGGEIDALVGKKAPAFRLTSGQGEVVSSASLAGAPYVLYFYPKDSTPGCTQEACDFRDAQAGFERLGARVLGVSPDSPQSHEKFSRAQGLNFDLLSDPEHQLAEKYGVWGKKKNYGREYFGIVRSTFVIDAGGRVRAAYRGVRVGGHVKKVLEELGR